MPQPQHESRQEKQRQEKPGPRVALIDASNVAHSSEGDTARLANILAVRDKLVEEGYQPVIVADAALRH